MKGINQLFHIVVLEDIGPFQHCSRELQLIFQKESSIYFIPLHHKSIKNASSDGPGSVAYLNFDFSFKAEFLHFTRRTLQLLKSNHPTIDMSLFYGETV